MKESRENPSTLSPRQPHPNAHERGSKYLHRPGGSITQGTNGVALYLFADLPEGVDLGRPGVPLHEAGHHLVHPVHACSQSRKGRPHDPQPGRGEGPWARWDPEKVRPAGKQPLSTQCPQPIQPLPVRLSQA